jgi:hypothetical protein
MRDTCEKLRSAASVPCPRVCHEGRNTALDQSVHDAAQHDVAALSREGQMAKVPALGTGFRVRRG